MKQELVQVDRLTIGYSSRQGQMVDILRNVSLDMSQGEILGLVGESGCGKSTLGLALLGFLRPGGRRRTGTVCFDGVDLFGLTLGELEQFRGKRVALIPQSTGQSLTPTMRVGAQIAEVLTLHLGYDQAAARDRVVELMSQVKLPQPATMGNRYPHELSGGQLQRVGISIALAGMPELLVLDEPTTGLDVTTQAHILALLRGNPRKNRNGNVVHQPRPWRDRSCQRPRGGDVRGRDCGRWAGNRCFWPTNPPLHTRASGLHPSPYQGQSATVHAWSAARPRRTRGGLCFRTTLPLH